ncbi:hypothetical protein RFN66_05500 [Bacillus paralicheniformis]|uniref:hypothetical protein n=1 Tax=Bacillus paralicheniformis TaxID=1648923 RepID=UPI002867D680|nr:hypothetical protein [Bacillus paralicheniformis]WMW48415.1 hypothetical protein RFN66_05500 [Bacillus paralicheniformis]
MNYTECPKCGNKRIKEVGEEALGYVRSVSTGKMLKTEKTGATIWFRYECKCGWKSKEFAE